MIRYVSKLVLNLTIKCQVIIACCRVYMTCIQYRLQTGFKYNATDTNAINKQSR